MIRNTGALIALLSALAMSTPAQAQSSGQATQKSRWDVSLDLPVWSALGDLQPESGGSFDATGYGLGVSYHFPIASYANSDLLLGFDGSIAATDSNIRGLFADLLARQIYLGGSVKWMFGKSRNVSLDAGIGYHEVDIAQVDSEWWGTREFEHWDDSKASGFAGLTWDMGAGRPHRNSGVFLGLRVHFADFGRVYDKDNAGFFPTLGSNAGRLDGPLYMLRIGYSGR